MSLQIRSIVIYSRIGERREVPFRLGALNVVTGAPRTGKSALLDIVEYCWGRAECTVPEGPIRRAVAWYGVLFDNSGEGIFVARRNPNAGDKASDEIYLERGVQDVPPDALGLTKNTTNDALKRLFSGVLGISENEHRPPEGQTRASLEANARHAILFCFQAQDEIASRRTLFHRQGDQWIPQAIKDTLPYFLGAVDEDRVRKQLLLDDERRRLRRLERRLAEARAADDEDYSRARSLLDEGKRVGLVDQALDAKTRAEALEALRSAAARADTDGDLVADDPADDLANLQEQRRQLRMQLSSSKDEIREAELLLSGAVGFEREVAEQRARLSTIGLITCSDAPQICPLCDSALEPPPPGVEEVHKLLRDITAQLDAVRRENPRVQERLAQLEAERANVEDRLRENQRAITARVQDSERLRGQQDAFVQRARVAGRVAFYLETAATAEGDDGLKEDVERLRGEVEELEKALDPEVVEEKITTALNVVGRYMTEYAERMEIEHGNNALRLDRKNLTVVADTIDGPIPLTRMGSGENWIGYHIVSHLGLHKLFRNRNRPVPGLLMLDQPSQAYYPPERDEEGDLSILPDEDQAAVRRIFKLLHDFTVELAPYMQIIVVDHADIKESWFEEAVVERWRRGVKLVPQTWLDDQ